MINDLSPFCRSVLVFEFALWGHCTQAWLFVLVTYQRNKSLRGKCSPNEACCIKTSVSVILCLTSILYQNEWSVPVTDMIPTCCRLWNVIKNFHCGTTHLHWPYNRMWKTCCTISKRLLPENCIHIHCITLIGSPHLWISNEFDWESINRNKPELLTC